MATQPLHHYSLEEYFAFDDNAEIPHEYIEGEIVPAFDGTPTHSVIAGNAFFHLRTQLSTGPCEAYATGLRVMLSAKKNYAYPDVAVVCGSLEYSDSKQDTITNPKVVFEVLSRTTRNYDLGEKLRLYWNLASLTDVILVDQQIIWIEYWSRAAAGEWKKRIFESGDDILRIESLACEIQVAALYLGVKLS